MDVRIKLAKAIIRLGAFIQTLAVSVMKPSDLVRFGHISYSRPSRITEWSSDPLVRQGLSPIEKEMIRKIQHPKGEILILGVGGGREALAFAKMGYNVSGIDFIPGMVRHAEDNLKKNGYILKGMVQDIANLSLENSVYDIVWLSSSMYSSIPTRQRRMNMNSRIFDSLKPGGFFLCQYHRREQNKGDRCADFLRRVTAWITLGHVHYQRGDRLWFNNEFVHFFASDNEVVAEFKESGFRVVEMNVSGPSSGELILRKPEITTK